MYRWRVGRRDAVVAAGGEDCSDDTTETVTAGRRASRSLQDMGAALRIRLDEKLEAR
jgi:hypothetical protein